MLNINCLIIGKICLVISGKIGKFGLCMCLLKYVGRNYLFVIYNTY